MVVRTLVQDKLGNLTIIEKALSCENGRSVSRELRKVNFGSDTEKVIEYMETHAETPQSETKTALEYFENEGHNKAEFGIWGGFVFSSFEGTLN
jgi:hypothetical protein